MRKLPRLVVNKGLDDRELTVSVLVAMFKLLLPTEPLRELYLSIPDELFGAAKESEAGRLAALKVIHRPVHWARSDFPEQRLCGEGTISAVRRADSIGQESALAWARRWRLATPGVVRWAVQQRRYWALFGRSDFFSDAVPQSQSVCGKGSSSDSGKGETSEDATPQVEDRSKSFQNAKRPWSQLPFFSDGYRGSISPGAAKVLKTLDAYPANGRWAEGRPWPWSRAEVNSDLSALRHIVDDSGQFVQHAPQRDTWLDGALTQNDQAAAPVAWDFWIESEEDVIARIRQHCAARRALLAQHYPTPLHGAAERREVERHCRWLLRARLLTHSLDRISSTENHRVTPKAISVAIARLERLLELDPVRRRARRPGQKIGT